MRVEGRGRGEENVEASVYKVFTETKEVCCLRYGNSVGAYSVHI